MHIRRPLDLGLWGLALIVTTYVIYVPVGPQLIHNEMVYGENGQSETLQKIWGGLRYVAALAIAPAVLMARGFRPLGRCWPVLLFVLFAAASYTWSAFPKESMRQSLNLFAVLAIAASLAGWRGLARFGRGLQIVTGLFMVASLLTALLIPQLGVHHAYDLVTPGHAGRWRGIFMHKNLFGGVAAAAIIYGLRSIRHETTAWKAFFIAARICAVVGLIMSGSASAWGAALVAVVFFTLMKFRVTSNPLSIGAMLLIGVALVQGLSLSAGSFAQALGRDATFTGRTSIWALGWPMIRSHWLFGSGFAADGTIFGELAKRDLFASAVDLHSGYLDVLFNLGLIGAALMALAVGAAMLRGYAYSQTHSGEERDQAVIFMTMVVASCAMAAAEVAPFNVLGTGSVGLWTALPALYQLGSAGRRARFRARPKPARTASK
jgi:O-antigen ligase